MYILAISAIITIGVFVPVARVIKSQKAHVSKFL
jgi:hypothetical protein